MYIYICFMYKYIYIYIYIYIFIYRRHVFIQKVWKKPKWVWVFYTYILTFVYDIQSLYIIDIYILRKRNNYSLKSAQHRSIIILWKEDDEKQL